MKAYSKDLRQKIVNALSRGMPKAQVARTFEVGISTVKRYATKAQRGEPLEPGAAPSKRPKMDERVSKLLEEELNKRPCHPSRERCDYIETISGVSVSRSTMCRTIARVGSTRKKGTNCNRARRASKSRLANDGGPEVDPERLVFVDEMGVHTSLAPVYGYSRKGERVHLQVPRTRGRK